MPHGRSRRRGLAEDRSCRDLLVEFFGDFAQRHLGAVKRFLGGLKRLARQLRQGKQLRTLGHEQRDLLEFADFRSGARFGSHHETGLDVVIEDVLGAGLEACVPEQLLGLRHCPVRHGRHGSGGAWSHAEEPSRAGGKEGEEYQDNNPERAPAPGIPLPERPDGSGCGARPFLLFVAVQFPLFPLAQGERRRRLVVVVETVGREDRAGLWRDRPWSTGVENTVVGLLVREMTSVGRPRGTSSP